MDTDVALDADVVVIGAGITGCLTAREILERDPAARVVVVDRAEIAGGASRFSAGLHFPRGAAPETREMAAYSQSFYAKLKAADPGLPVHPLRMTVVAPAEAEAHLRETYLPEAELSRTAKPDRTATAAVHVPSSHLAWTGTGCQYADVPALTRRLALALRPRVVFREGVGAESVDPGPDAVEVALTTGERLAARRVVVAVGPWLPGSPWNAGLGARVKKVVALHVELPPGPGDPAIVFEQEDAFLLPLAHRGHWLFSYTCTDWDVLPDELGRGLTAGELRPGRELLAAYAPEMAAHCASGRVFCDAYSPDRTPLVRPLAGDHRVVVAGAANGSGYRLAPAIAVKTADLLFPLASLDTQETR
ncbi:FAD-binding oxidoreductase [Actinomadura sp. KC06]|uniref:NAD(P)/FAD-dependent oxidoreductase n=1 Tax=Actinomadura sp. KC06 TaxID=2530369 RepID=UPI001046231B|nr:FAD-binding oxidoreductase [Actinomadura sp. KC06]TDD34951.1 FAD-binding oxidoreductase [Actinomadura sp. KC06]